MKIRLLCHNRDIDHLKILSNALVAIGKSISILDCKNLKNYEVKKQDNLSYRR